MDENETYLEWGRTFVGSSWSSRCMCFQSGPTTGNRRREQEPSVEGFWSEAPSDSEALRRLFSYMSP